MRHIRAALARIAGFFTGHRADDDLRDEMQAHLEMETAENIRRGMRPDEARRQALLASGGLTAGRRGGPRSARTALDREHRGRHQVRRCARCGTAPRSPPSSCSPWRSASAPTRRSSASSAACCSSRCRTATATGWSTCGSRSTDPGGANIAFSVPEVRDFRDGAPVARRHRGVLAVVRARCRATSDAVRIDVGLVTGNYFEVMGLSPVLGPADAAERRRHRRAAGDGADARLLDEALRRRLRASSASRCGWTASRSTVIGVLQPAPFFPDRVDALLNMVISQHHLSALMVRGPHASHDARWSRGSRPAPRVEQARSRGRRGLRRACSASTRTRTTRARTTASPSSRSRKCSASGRG